MKLLSLSIAMLLNKDLDINIDKKIKPKSISQIKEKKKIEDLKKFCLNNKKKYRLYKDFPFLDKINKKDAKEKIFFSKY